MRTLGGLFSGIGGFELAWQRAGGRVAWMCEIDPAARKVLQSRFPGVPVYPDVSQLDPAEVEPVDVLTGGSPCQGFSIAGARTGLEHVESRLFADYVRIMDGLAARGLSYAVWENVPGVLSITNDDGERTFPHVVAALVGADRPVQLDGRVRWNTGMAARGSRAVAWRVVDSRHFGVPQRRRRVYACVAFGGAAEGRAFGALLAKPEGVSGDSAACRTAREDVAGGVGAGVAGSFTFDRANVTSRLNRTQVGPGVPVGTLGVSTDHHAVVPHTAKCLTTGGISGWRADADVETFIPEVAGPLGSKMAGAGFPDDLDRMTFVPDVAHTLRGEGHDASEDGTGRGTPIIAPPIAATLTRGSSAGANPPGRRQEDDENVVAQSFNWQQGDAEYQLADDAHTLGTTSAPGVLQPLAFAWQAGGGRHLCPARSATTAPPRPCHATRRLLQPEPALGRHPRSGRRRTRRHPHSPVQSHRLRVRIGWRQPRPHRCPANLRRSPSDPGRV
jgi:hypothetical protein